MSFTNRLYNDGEKKHYLNSAVTTGAFQYLFLRMGVIEIVDLDKYEMTVVWLDNSGTRDRIPISFPYISPAGCMGALPEKGTIGIFGFYNEGGNKGRPLLLNYLPAGLSNALDFNDVQVIPDSLSPDDLNVVSFKFRKLGPGDMIMSSSLGSSVFLNTNVEIRDGMHDSILLREEFRDICSTSVNNHMFADGASVSAGPAIRNFLATHDLETGKKLDNNGSRLPLLCGKDLVYIVPHGGTIEYGTKYYTEYRIDVDEQGDAQIDMNDINGTSPLSTRSPIVTMAMGNYIGANKSNSGTYGRILKAKIFKDGDDVVGGFVLEEAKQNNGIDEPSTLGLAYALDLKSGSFMGFDKEGHHYVNLKASNAGGAGRSMSLLAQGNLKEIWGSSYSDGNSWDLTTKGGVKWLIGAHNSNGSGRSIDIKASSGISIEVGSGDENGYAKSEILQGAVSEIVTGSKSATCLNLEMLINGLKTESISGTSTETVGGLKSLGAASYSETISGKLQSMAGSRNTTISTGDDTLTLTKGSLKETLISPSPLCERSTLMAVGSITQTVGSGSISSSITTAGKYEVNVTSGAINIKTSVGVVTVEGTTVSVNGSAVAQIKAPLVTMGKRQVKGMVITGLPAPSTFCYISGVPLKGLSGVLA